MSREVKIRVSSSAIGNYDDTKIPVKSSSTDSQIVTNAFPMTPALHIPRVSDAMLFEAQPSPKRVSKRRLYIFHQ